MKVNKLIKEIKLSLSNNQEHEIITWFKSIIDGLECDIKYGKDKYDDDKNEYYEDTSVSDAESISYIIYHKGGKKFFQEDYNNDFNIIFYEISKLDKFNNDFNFIPGKYQKSDTDKMIKFLIEDLHLYLPYYNKNKNYQYVMWDSEKI